jgi:truncated hemoglobin YjbI
VKEMRVERGVAFSYEAVRCCAVKFGAGYAGGPRCKRLTGARLASRRGCRPIDGEQRHLWCSLIKTTMSSMTFAYRFVATVIQNCYSARAFS